MESDLMTHSRRTFLKEAAGAVLAGPYVLRSRAAESQRRRTVLIGCGWWGKNILREAMACGRCQVVALADVDATVLEVARDQVQDLSGDQPKGYEDYRELLERERPEVTIVGTPDHWHALISIAALKSGSHVFVEKPTGHSVNESRAMLRVAKETGRLVQVGLHRRIGPHHVAAMKFLKSGQVGPVGMVRLFAHGGGGAEQPAANEEPPEGMNWDLWCGPAPRRPFNKRLHPGGWRNFLDYGNGTLGDWGVHWMDQVLWWSEEDYPRRVFCSGGRPIRGPAVLDDRGQTSDAPDHQVAIYEFSKFTCVWEHRRFAGNAAEKHSIGAYFYGTKGTLHIGWRDGWTFYPADSKGTVLHEPSQLQEPDGHNLKLLWGDFMMAIDTQRAPVSNIEVAHRASVMPLLGMISWRLGRSLNWDGVREDFVGDAEASRLLSRPYRSPWIYPGV